MKTKDCDCLECQEAQARRERNREALILGFRLLALIAIVWALVHVGKI